MAVSAELNHTLESYLSVSSSPRWAAGEAAWAAFKPVAGAGRCEVGWGRRPPASRTPASPARRKPRPWRPLPLLIGRSCLKATGGPPARVSAIKAAHA